MSNDDMTRDSSRRGVLTAVPGSRPVPPSGPRLPVEAFGSELEAPPPYMVVVIVTTDGELPASAAELADLVMSQVDLGALAPAVAEGEAEPPDPPEPSAGPVLSARERQVLRHIAAGLTHAQAARRMGVSKATVDTYIERVRRKLGAGNKADLTRAALMLDLAERSPA